MTNKIQEGRLIDVAFAVDTAPGDVVVVGDLVGVAVSGGKAGTVGAVEYTGVYSLPKATTNGSAIAQGTIVYWDSVNKVITATAGAFKSAGKTWFPSVDGDAFVAVRLFG